MTITLLAKLVIGGMAAVVLVVWAARGLAGDLSRCAGEARCIGSEGVAE